MPTTFEEAFDYVSEANRECDEMIYKTIIFAEACYRDYQINLKQADLKIMQEAGTDEDREYLYNEAASSFSEKAKKTIAKAAESFVKFLEKIASTIANVFRSQKTKETMSKTEKAIKANPKMRSKKVSVNQTEKEVNIIQKAIDKLKRKEASAKSGKYSKNDDKEIDSIVEDCNKKRNAIATGAKIVIPITAAIVLWNTLVNKTDSTTKESIKQAKALREAARKGANVSKLDKGYRKGTKAMVNDIKSKATAAKKEDLETIKDMATIDGASRIAMKARLQIFALEKMKISTLTNGIKNVFHAIKGETASKNIESTTESAEENVPTEGTNSDYLDNLYNQLFPESTSVSESADDLDAYLSNLEQEIAESSNDKNEIESDNILEAMEAELLGEEDTPVTESEDIILDTEEAVNNYLEQLETMV